VNSFINQPFHRLSIGILALCVELGNPINVFVVGVLVKFLQGVVMNHVLLSHCFTVNFHWLFRPTSVLVTLLGVFGAPRSDWSHTVSSMPCHGAWCCNLSGGVVLNV